jgi:Fic family protein
MRLGQNPSGRVVVSPSGYKSFIPAPLPPQLEITMPLQNALSRADYLLGKLSGIGAKLPNPHLLIRSFITREAVLSSKIEGTRATLGEVLAHEAGVHIDTNQNDIQEVRNYIEALDHGINLLDSLPLSLRMIKEVHFKLMQGVRGGSANSGEFRKIQNWIGGPSSDITTATYVPPPPDELMACLSDLEQFLHNIMVPPIMHAAICHYQFEAIHPFIDGNGRTGRLLISLLLIERKILPSPLLYLSAFFEATRRDYYRLLHEVTAYSNWHDWLLYFINGVTLQAEDTISRTERIMELLDNWNLEVAKHGTPSMSKIVRLCAVNPYMTVQKVADELGVHYNTALKNLNTLVSQGIIQEVKEGKQREKVYCAVAIMKILEEPAKIYHDTINKGY